MSKTELPPTIDGAVRLMLGLVPEGEQARIAYMSEAELPNLYFALGQWVRNHLGLWGDNAALLAATGETNADDASALLVKAFWKQLRDESPKVHCPVPLVAALLVGTVLSPLQHQNHIVYTIYSGASLLRSPP